MSIPTTTIRTGIEHATALVGLVHSLLADLFAESPLSAYDVVMVARDPTYKLDPKVVQLVTGRSNALVLIQNGVMHDAVREIVLAATDGDGLQLRLLSMEELVKDRHA